MTLWLSMAAALFSFISAVIAARLYWRSRYNSVCVHCGHRLSEHDPNYMRECKLR